MKMTDGEKLTILMLSELYEKLGVEGEIDPDFIKSAIFGDQLWGIKWKYSGIPFEDSDDPEVVKEVVDILDMWGFIEYAYSSLTDEEKQQLEVEAEPFGKDPKFRGFDGNNETEHMATARFLINDLDRFQEFKGRDLNSHMQSLEWYNRMLEAFEPIRKNLTNKPMSVEDLTVILKSQIHPNKRSD